MNAKIHLEKAIALNPEFAEAYYELGMLLKEQGEIKESVKNLKKSVSINNDFAEAQCELAIALTADGDHENARNHFLNSLEINPNYAYAYFNYGLLLIQIKDIEEAKNNFDKVTEINQNYAPAYYYKATLLTNADDYEDAISILGNEDEYVFNMISAPGLLYSIGAHKVVLDSIISLSETRGDNIAVVDLRPYESTVSNVTGTADTLNSSYAATYWPWLQTVSSSGRTVWIPASVVIPGVYAFTDGANAPWFAPAGTRRGGISNATAVGFIDAATGEFQTVALNEGQRDTLYQSNVNPITFLNGAGLVVFGQKTRARNASSLDRVNVARLVIYLRSQLKQLAKPYIFEPNDKITRDELKQQVESLLVELVGLRALYDYLVVCDETNNTPARIDRNELYVDIAIEPVKAVEFIYIPLRLKNTGEIAGL